MKIGIPADYILNKEKSGIEIYLVEILKNLTRIDKSNHYFLYSKKEINKESLKLGENFTCKTLKPLKFWMSLRLPLQFVKDRIDIGFFPAFHMPMIWSPGKKIVTIHDLSFIVYPEYFRKEDIKWLLKVTDYSVKHADIIITDSISTKNDILKYYKTDEKKIKVIYCGKDENFKKIYDMDKIENIKRKYNIYGKYILYIGVLQPRKNISRILRAYKILLEKENIEHLLVIAGRKGWFYEEFYREVEVLGIKNKVIFTGYIQEEDKVYIYNGADLFVFPSLYEGFGLPVLEAMSCGTPVVTSNVSSLCEVAGDACLIIDPNSVDEIATAVSRILNSKDLKNELIEKGYRQAEKFNWKITAEKLLQTIEGLSVGNKR